MNESIMKDTPHPHTNKQKTKKNIQPQQIYLKLAEGLFKHMEETETNIKKPGRNFHIWNPVQRTAFRSQLLSVTSPEYKRCCTVKATDISLRTFINKQHNQNQETHHTQQEKKFKITVE